MMLSGRTIFPGVAEAEILKTSMGISFFGGVDPDTGQIIEKGHELEGQFIGGKILVFPTGKGSTVGSYTIYRLKSNGVAPAAIINAICEPITAVGCIIAEIPCIDKIQIEQIPQNAHLKVNATSATIEVLG